ncbi:reverse transcriptase family protein [Shinella sp. CPCC 101442]|uniref:reverse transcriptase family protein n=1 Tax=Shinella sp. CPCC 101442 TaxID=2932265 RepID=UPI002152790C|nr:reverse transcriptase family protein [Shinella sp. CPCC 101442]MCR6499501.1 reverse transcriptase family protein [Shinella sp. CPCC 101442]
MLRRFKRNNTERYELARSPLGQHPTQRDIGALLGETRDDLRRLVDYKEQFVVRRIVKIGKKQKVRDLRYPVSRLRRVHERLKFHLNKIKQPSYLFNPRKKRGQRDNAAHHLDQKQYLTIDLKQFYPSTTSEMVKHWFRSELGMYEDVAGLLTHLCTIDGRVSLGSPVTPVLCSLVHRAMFDEIANLCDQHNLRYSVWVDDLTISGEFVPGIVVAEIREIIRHACLKSHKIRYRTGNRPVFVTGVGVVGAKLAAPNTLNLKIKELWENLHSAETLTEKDSCIQALLTNLGTVRYIVGYESLIGQKASNQMNMLRQKRAKLYRLDAQKTKLRRHNLAEDVSTSLDAPFDL